MLFRSNNFFYRHISKLIYTSGSDLTFQQIISKSLLLFILSFVITKILGMYFLISFFIALIFSCYPIINLIIKRKKRLLKFDEQLPDALDFISRALAAGHSLTYAIQGLSQEMSPPISYEFKTLSDQISYGISFNEALSEMAEKIPSQDLNFFIISLLIQKD